DTLSLTNPDGFDAFGNATINIVGLQLLAGGGIEVGGQNGVADGQLLIDSGGTVIGHGTISIGSGQGSNVLGLVDNGTIAAHEGTLFIHGDVTGTGGARIDSNATLELDGAFSGVVHFNGGYETSLRLDDLAQASNPHRFTGSITGLAPGDTIKITRDVLCD